MMPLSRLLYLFAFFAPVMFLLGYMVGAPKPVQQRFDTSKIDTRKLPVSPIDFYRHEGSLMVDDQPWLQPNNQVGPQP